MALTEFEKTMIRRVDAEIRARQLAAKPGENDEETLTTILEGTENERRLLVENYVAAVGIPACNADIAAADAQKTAAQTLLAEMQAYIS